MNTRFRFGIAALVLILTVNLYAADFNVVYLEGRLEYREGQNTWTALRIGDSISAGRTLRLSGRGFAELSSGDRRVTLTEDGLYETSDLAVETEKNPGLLQAIGSKFSMLRNRPESATTVAAVRAAEAEGDDTAFITWEDEFDSPLEKGLSLYFEGKYTGAQKAFEEGIASESGEVQRECLYWKGLCQLNLGDSREARRTLAAVNAQPEDPFIHDYTILMGTLYIESMDYADADRTLASYLTRYPRGEAAQAAWVLSAYSFEAQGNSQASRNSLNKAVELGPNTEIGRAASAKMN